MNAAPTCSVVETIEAGGLSATWFTVTHAGVSRAVIALSAPELLQPMFFVYPLEEAREQYSQAAEAIVKRAEETRAPLSESFDDETSFRDVGGFDPVADRWFDR